MISLCELLLSGAYLGLCCHYWRKSAEGAACFDLFGLADVSDDCCIGLLRAGYCWSCFVASWEYLDKEGRRFQFELTGWVLVERRISS